jgi:hypothetical protein
MSYLVRPDYDDMQDWAYREANPGYEREIGLTASDLREDDGYGEPMDPELMEMIVDSNARDNAKRRENNLRTDNNRLRALLVQHGINPDTED